MNDNDGIDQSRLLLESWKADKLLALKKSELREKEHARLDRERQHQERMWSANTAVQAQIDANERTTHIAHEHKLQQMEIQAEVTARQTKIEHELSMRIEAFRRENSLCIDDNKAYNSLRLDNNQARHEASLAYGLESVRLQNNIELMSKQHEHATAEERLRATYHLEEITTQLMADLIRSDSEHDRQIRFQLETFAIEMKRAQLQTSQHWAHTFAGVVEYLCKARIDQQIKESEKQNDQERAKELLHYKMMLDQHAKQLDANLDERALSTINGMLDNWTK